MEAVTYLDSEGVLVERPRSVVWRDGVSQKERVIEAEGAAERVRVGDGDGDERAIAGDGVADERAADSDSAADSAAAIDERLVRAFQRSGDDASFVALLERHRGRIRAALYALLGGGGDVADAEQETIIALWRALPAFRGRSSFATYLYRICCNTVYSYMRRAKRARAVSFDEQAHGRHDGAAAEDILQRNDRRAFVRRTLTRLKPGDRLVIHLREFEGYPLAECAKILACSLGTVKSKLHRAKKRLARILEEYEYDERETT